MKFYEFRYRSKLAKIAAGIISTLICLIYPPVIAFIFIIILNFFGVNDYWPTWCAPAIMGISVILGFVFVIKYFSNYKGVMINDNNIEIERYSITDFHPVPNFKISYKDIKYVYNSRQKIGLHSFKARKSLFTGCDLSYYIEIGLNGGKSFYFSVEKQEEFAQDLINQINKYREENNLEKL